MEDNQLGRRNLTADQFKLLLGRKYNRLKKSQGGTGANQHSEQKAQNGPLKSTSETVAEQHGIGERTVKRVGAMADAVDNQVGTPSKCHSLVQTYSELFDFIAFENRYTITSTMARPKDRFANPTLEIPGWLDFKLTSDTYKL